MSRMSCEMIHKGKTRKVGSEADEEGKAPKKEKPWHWTPHAAQEPVSTASSRAVSGCELPRAKVASLCGGPFSRKGAAGSGYADPVKGRWAGGVNVCWHVHRLSRPWLLGGPRSVWGRLCGQAVWVLGWKSEGLNNPHLVWCHD